MVFPAVRIGKACAAPPAETGFARLAMGAWGGAAERVAGLPAYANPVGTHLESGTIPACGASPAAALAGCLNALLPRSRAGRIGGTGFAARANAQAPGCAGPADLVPVTIFIGGASSFPIHAPAVNAGVTRRTLLAPRARRRFPCGPRHIESPGYEDRIWSLHRLRRDQHGKLDIGRVMIRLQDGRINPGIIWVTHRGIGFECKLALVRSIICDSKFQRICAHGPARLIKEPGG